MKRETNEKTDKCNNEVDKLRKLDKTVYMWCSRLFKVVVGVYLIISCSRGYSLNWSTFLVEMLAVGISFISCLKIT